MTSIKVQPYPETLEELKDYRVIETRTRYFTRKDFSNLRDLPDKGFFGAKSIISSSQHIKDFEGREHNRINLLTLIVNFDESPQWWIRLEDNYNIAQRHFEGLERPIDNYSSRVISNWQNAGLQAHEESEKRIKELYRKSEPITKEFFDFLF